jgi:predicted nucleic acid-binding protein
MRAIVLDGSVALSWVLPGELTASTQTIRVSIEAGNRTIVPAHWALEIANALWAAERRKRIAQPDTAAALAALEKMSMESDTETARRAGRETLALARQNALSVYDAAYLELAMRRGARLASLDGQLRAAAKKLNVPLLPESI